MSALVIALVAFGIVGAALVYNRLVRLRHRVTNAVAQIDVQLRRRHDLIPSLVAAVQGYLTHERETLHAVTAARTGAVQAQRSAQPSDAASMGALASAESALTGVLGRLMAVVEA